MPIPVYKLTIDLDAKPEDFKINVVPEEELIDPAFKWTVITKEDGKIEDKQAAD